MAAARELFEEVGIQVSSERLLPLAQMVVRHSNIEDHVWLFELRLEVDPVLRIDGREIVEAFFRSPDQLSGLPLWPPLRTWLEGRTEPGRRG